MTTIKIAVDRTGINHMPKRDLRQDFAIIRLQQHFDFVSRKIREDVLEQASVAFLRQRT